MESYGLLFSGLMLVAFLLSAWGGLSTVESGMTDSSLPGYLSFNYNKFRGVKKAKIHFDRGDEIRLYYNLKIKDGYLVVFVKDPQNRIMWQKTFKADATDTINLRSKRPGNYQLIIEGNNTGGGFDIQWNFDEI
ncbi:MAG: hypothetical protein P8074_11200 [Anaerolineales bacterium]|jgi:hypothetical protein